MNPERNESQFGQGIFKALSQFAPVSTKLKENDCRSKDPSLEKNTIYSNLLNDQNLPQDRESPTGETKQDRLKTKCQPCENAAADSFKKSIENDLENRISTLEAENSKLKQHVNKLESMTIHLLAENESQEKKIEQLLSEKIALEVTVDKLKSLDEYVKVLEKERCAFVEVERERDQLRIQVLKEKEKSKDVAGLQQFVKKLTKEYDTLNSLLSQQQDAAESALKQVSNELKEEKELSDKLFVVSNQLSAEIFLLKKTQQALLENKEFYKKKFNVRLSSLNRQILEMESAKSYLSESCRMFDSTLRQIKMILCVAEHSKKTGLPPHKLVLLFKIFQAALVRLSSEIEGIRRSLPKVYDDKKERIQLRSYSDSEISVKALTVEKSEPFFSVKSMLIGLCAGNRLLVEKLFSAENLSGNEDVKIAKINANAIKQSSLGELERKNCLKTEKRKVFLNDSVVTVNLDEFVDLVIPYLLHRICKNSPSAFHISFKPRVNYLRPFTSACASKSTGRSRLKPEIKLNDSSSRKCEKSSRNVCIPEKNPNQFLTPSNDSNLNMPEVTLSYHSQRSSVSCDDPRNIRFITPSLEKENFGSKRDVIQDGVKYVQGKNDTPDDICNVMTETRTLLGLASDFDCPVKDYASAEKNTEILRLTPLKSTIQEASIYSLVARTPATKDQICKIRELSEIFPWSFPEQDSGLMADSINEFQMSAREVYLWNTLNFLLSPRAVHDQLIHPSNSAVFEVNNVEIELSTMVRLPEVTSESTESYEHFKKEIHSKTFNSAVEVVKCNEKYSLELMRKSSASIDYLSGPETLERVKNSDDLKSFEKFQPFVGSNSVSFQNLIDGNAMKSKYYLKSVEKIKQLNCKAGGNIDVNRVCTQRRKDDSNHLSRVQFSSSKQSNFAGKSEKKINWFSVISSLRLKNFKLQKRLLNFKMEATSLKNLKADFEKNVKKLDELMVEKNDRDSINDSIKKEYKQRIAELTEGYEGKLTEVKDRHNKDFKLLSQIYVEKLKHANEIHAQNIENTEESNLRALKDYRNFYNAEIGKWETLMDQYSQKLLDLKNVVSEADEKMNAQLLNAVNNYESLLHRVCEAFDNEKAAMYALLSENLKNFEDDFKDNLRKIATKLDNDSVILHRLFEKELGRCKRKYEHNLKQQKSSYKILLEEAKMSYEKKVSQKNQLTFSKVLVCNCDSAISQI